MKNRKAQVNIIAVVLIILVVIIGIVILWNVVSVLVKEQSQEIDTNPLKTQIEIKEAVLFVNGASKITLTRTGGSENIDEIKFSFYDDRNNIHLENVKENMPLQLESRTYYFSPILNFGKIEKIEVSPFINGKSAIGDKTEANNIFEIPRGLISWWRFQGDARDFVGGNNGGVFGEVSFLKEENKNSVFFKNGYIDFGSDSSLDLNKDFAISFWIKTESGEGGIIGKGNNYQVFISNGYINFSYSSSGVIKNIGSFSNIADGQWHQIVITNFAVYIDGKTNKIVSIMDNFDNNNDNLVIGKNFNGYIGEVMIFNEALDMNQAKSLMNIG